MLSMLEPVATAGFAVCLAYLALDRFRYRSAVENGANKLKDEIGVAMEKENVLDASNELRWMCREECNGHSPIGFLANAYHLFYRNSLDIKLVSGGAVVCFSVLALGAGLEIGKLGFLSFLEGSGWIGALYWFCIASSVTPVASILFGRRCAKWGVQRTAHLKKQLEQVMSHQAQQAQPVA